MCLKGRIYDLFKRLWVRDTEKTEKRKKVLDIRSDLL
jgi:hypothetical protein